LLPPLVETQGSPQVEFDEFREFYEACHGKVIYKLLGFPFYRDTETDVPVSTYTSFVPGAMLEQAHRVAATLHLFQQFVEKRCDLRVIIIGQELFAVEIHPLSEETRLDFRRDYTALRYAIHHLPATIQNALLEMNRRYRLNYAAVDMLYMEDGRYIYLETNPSGQFGWLTGPTNLPLYHRLAHLLAMGEREKE
jgi:hypothetical protein